MKKIGRVKKALIGVTATAAGAIFGLGVAGIGEESPNPEQEAAQECLDAKLSPEFSCTSRELGSLTINQLQSQVNDLERQRKARDDQGDIDYAIVGGVLGLAVGTGIAALLVYRQEQGLEGAAVAQPSSQVSV